MKTPIHPVLNRMYWMPIPAFIALFAVVRSLGGLLALRPSNAYNTSAEAVTPINRIDRQIDTMAREAMELLVMQMNERKKRRPEPLAAPVHRIVTPVLVKRGT